MLSQEQEMILKELPMFMRSNPDFLEEVLSITRFHFADKVETESRFERMMEVLQEQNRKLDQKMEDDRKQWAENERRWQKNDLRWEENERRWQKNDLRWEENQKELVALNAALQEQGKKLDQKMEDDRKLWAENERRWKENDRRWKENQKELVALNAALQEQGKKLDQKMEDDRKQWAENKQLWEKHHEERAALLKALQDTDKKFERKFDQTLGALGARWGLHSEASFRNALAGILKDFSDVEVLNVNEYDHEGVVFGHPDQVELDIVIKNGQLMVCEIKSSMNKSDMYTFERKVRFYEQKQGRTAHRMIVISPMLDRYAQPVAKKLGIEVYSYADEVDLEKG
jgi:hypothetical protein